MRRVRNARRAPAHELEERDRHEREHDAAHPREVPGVDALHRLREDPEAEQPHDEEGAGP